MGNFKVRSRLNRSITGTYLAMAAFAAFPAGTALADGVINFGEDQNISVGFGVRTSVDFTQYGAPDGKSTSNDFQLDSLRLYINGQLNQYIKGTFNTETNSITGQVQLLDGIARLEFTDGFNIWAGRLLTPSDRANLDGPYYLGTWNYPGVVSQYPSAFEGRDDGVDIWGKLFDKHLVYTVGVFQGHNVAVGASNEADNPLYAGRVTYNFLDAEPAPFYYTGSTYYGKADILAVAFAVQYEKDGVGSYRSGLGQPGQGDYLGWNFDALFEKRLGGGGYKDGGIGGGVITLEGAYYHYDTGGKFDVVPSTLTSANLNSDSNVGGIQEGDGFLASIAYLIPGKVGFGQLQGNIQPSYRYQQFHNDLTNVTTEVSDISLNYIISGHNARISADYSYKDSTAGYGNPLVGGPGKIAATDVNAFVLGLQLQF